MSRHHRPSPGAPPPAAARVPAAGVPSRRVAPEGRATPDEDFARWAFEQAALLRAGRLEGLDAANIAEELEDLGRHEFRVLASALRVLLIHALKWDHQPERRSRSWANTIAAQRLEAARSLRENPSLRPRIDEAIAHAYAMARLRASSETGLPLRTFPPACPYDAAAVRDRRFDWPDEGVEPGREDGPDDEPSDDPRA